MRKSAIGIKHSEKVKQEMSTNRKGKSNPFFGKKHSHKSIELMKNAAKNRVKLPVPGIEVEVFDIEKNMSTIYNSIRKAATAMDTNVGNVLY